MPRSLPTLDTPPTHSVDPVCGMKVGPDSPHRLTTAQGEEILFCSAGCREKFSREPGRYAGAEGQRGRGTVTASRPLSPSAPLPLYTCPMHPEVVRDVPGSCPICGMALEPLVATGAEAANP